MTDRQPIDTQAALNKAWNADRQSRDDESYWASLKQTAIDIRRANHFRHTWAENIRTWRGPNDQS